MKLVTLCLFAVCCSSLANTSILSMQQRKFGEIQKELNDAKDSILKSDKMFNAPPQNIKSGCCVFALQCFRNNVAINRPQRKLFKSLRFPLIENALSFCSSGTNSTCQPCESFPKVNGREFFDRLQSLVQMGLTNLINVDESKSQ